MRRALSLAVLALLSGLVSGCGSSIIEPLATFSSTSDPVGVQATGGLTYMSNYQTAMQLYGLTGMTSPVRDPGIAYENGTYYVFTTDTITRSWTGNLHILTSTDRVHWQDGGTVFDSIPTWLQQKIPGITRLWAPDVSYFDGLYHVYYAATVKGTQISVIGLVTNRTLDRTSPQYLWVDQGEVWATKVGDDANAIDPNILVNTDGRVWMTYGSYWTGIKQREINPATGMLMSHVPRYSLVNRPHVPQNPVEAPSLLHYGNYYYLFVSMDYCCNAAVTTNNYKIVVGRSDSPNGPFVGIDGTPMLQGGGTVLLEGDGTVWAGVGGQTAWLDPTTNQVLLVFQAQKVSQGGTPYLWVMKLKWNNGWPTVQ